MIQQPNPLRLLNAITDRLEEEGVAAFAAAFHNLLADIETKIATMAETV